MTGQETSFNSSTAMNAAYAASSALQIRLDTTRILEDIERFLRGKKIVIKTDDNGKQRWEEQSAGSPKANDAGVHAILNFVSSIFNPQVVQGNFPSEGFGQSSLYEQYIEETNINLITTLIANCPDWEIEDNSINLICDFIMQLVIPFMTRLIDNKERDSYINTIRHNETHSVQPAESNGGVKIL